MRRSTLLLQATVLFLVTLSHLPSALAQKDNAKTIRALLVTGGCCHDYKTQGKLIKDGLEARANIEVTVIYEGGTAGNAKIPLYGNPKWADDYDVILHDECFAHVKDTAWTKRILSPHLDGKPAVVIHCAMHCYRDGTDEWFKFCGVTSRGHGAHYGHEVLNRDASNPIMKTFPAGWANPEGELYRIDKLWPTAHALASAKDRQKGTEEVCVWTNLYGPNKTRVFGTTLGHHNETVGHPQFLELLTRGTLWAAGNLNDDQLKKPAPKLVPVNIAKGKTVTASSVQKDSNVHHKPANAVDGNQKTRWCASNASAPQWLQIDLGQSQHLTGCNLIWESRDGIYKYQVDVSENGKDWRTVVDRSKNDDESNSLHEFDTNGRYLKVHFLGHKTGLWGSLWEVEIFGDEKVLVEPSQSTEDDKKYLADVRLPDGFEATLFAAPPAVNYPVFVAAAPDGTVYVSVDKNGSLQRDPNHGAIYRLKDIDNDGKADEVKLFVPNVDSPRGLVWDHDRLYVMHPPHLSAYIDHDGDGIADEEKVLVKNLAFTFKDRPADHTTNGVTLGIDGWLYIAAGDFGFMEAEGTDGRKLQLRGGGVVRVRPDGTGLQLYSRGTRNILEVAMDPLLNGFTRDNTNDGGGWDIRLHHFSGLEDHGYPKLYKNFNDEAIQPLADYGGGSGCGALYMDEPGFPNGFGNALYTADWGRQMIYRHNVTQNGATFTADQNDFLGLPRATDLDVDANSQIFAASWKGATFRYAGENVGYLVRLTPKGFKPQPLPDFAKLSDQQLVELLNDDSHRRRLEAQRTLIRRGIQKEAAAQLQALAANNKAKLSSRVAAIFALKQSLGNDSHSTLADLTKYADVRAFAIRAMADRWDQLENVPVKPLLDGLNDENPRVRLESVVAVARIGNANHAGNLIALLADPDPIIVHTAVESLVLLANEEACFEALEKRSLTTDVRSLLLRVLRRVHKPEVADKLIAMLNKETAQDYRQEILVALCRLYNVEGNWNGQSWGTRPDTRGPYYQPESWEASEKIGKILEQELKTGSSEEVEFLIANALRNRVERKTFGEILSARAESDPRFAAAAMIGSNVAGAIPEKSIPLFIKVATDGKMSPDLRAKAIGSLFRTNRDETFESGLKGLAELHQLQDKAPFDIAWNALRDRNVLIANAERIQTIANGDPKLELAYWGDAALHLLSIQKKLKGKPAQIVEETMAAGWKTPDRRMRLLKAALLADVRTFEPKIIEALKDSDPAVVKQAQVIASAWKISTTKMTGPKISTMKPEDVIAKVLKMKGDQARGEQLSVKLNCLKCHTVKKGQALIGPYLPNVAKTYKRNQLAESVLLPSKSIAQGFVTNVFVLDSGKAITGFVTSEAADEVVIRNKEGEETKIPTSTIIERAKQEISSMPDGLVKELTLQEFADLIVYLESLKSEATK